MTTKQTNTANVDEILSGFGALSTTKKIVVGTGIAVGSAAAGYGVMKGVAALTGGAAAETVAGLTLAGMGAAAIAAAPFVAGAGATVGLAYGGYKLIDAMLTDDDEKPAKATVKAEQQSQPAPAAEPAAA